MYGVNYIRTVLVYTCNTGNTRTCVNKTKLINKIPPPCHAYFFNLSRHINKGKTPEM